MKLEKLSDYVIELRESNIKWSEFRNLIIKYTSFLKQKPEKWMFVACDKDGNVLKEPIKPVGYDTWKKGDGGADGIACVNYEQDLKEYQEAQERVTFKGFTYEREILKYNTVKIIVHSGGFYTISKEINTLEDLTPYNLELIKEI